MKRYFEVILFGLCLEASTPLLFACEDTETIFQCLHIEDTASVSDVQKAFYKYSVKFNPNEHPPDEFNKWNKKIQKLFALYKTYIEVHKVSDAVNNLNNCARSVSKPSSTCSANASSSRPVPSYARFHAYWERKKKEDDRLRSVRETFTNFLNTLVPGSYSGNYPEKYKVEWEPRQERNSEGKLSRKMLEITSTESAHEEAIQKVANKLRSYSFEITEQTTIVDSKGIARIWLPQNETNKRALDILLYVHKVGQRIGVAPIKIEQQHMFEIDNEKSGPIKKIILRFKAEQEKDQFLSEIRKTGHADQDTDHGQASDGTWFVHLRPELVLGQ